MSTEPTAADPTDPVAPPAWLEGAGRAALEAALPGYLAGRRWFGGKARSVAGVRVVASGRLGVDAAFQLVVVEVAYAGGGHETYALPLALATGAEGARLLSASTGSVVMRCRAGAEDAVLHAPDGDPRLARAVADAIATAARWPASDGEIAAWPTRALAAFAGELRAATPEPLGAEQSNTSFRLGRVAVLKLFRRTAAGPNPDVEMGAFLTEAAAFPHVPPLLGGMELRSAAREPYALAILQGFVPNDGDAWTRTVGQVRTLLASAAHRPAPPAPARPWHQDARPPPPPDVLEVAGTSLAEAALLGRRTAELHLALASHPEVDAFRPEPLAPADVRALHAAARSQASTALALLRERRADLGPDARARADRVLAGAPVLERALAAVLSPPPASWRTRTHGDYHLGQVLWTGQDFVLIDFEGEPARPLAERRARMPPVRDVAGMIRSYHYAAYQGLAEAEPEAAGARELEAWARSWYGWAAATFAGAYEETWRARTPLADDAGGRRRLLELFLAEKAFYELAYELNHRPGWAWLPLRGLEDLAGLAAAGP